MSLESALNHGLVVGHQGLAMLGDKPTLRTRGRNLGRLDWHRRERSEHIGAKEALHESVSSGPGRFQLQIMEDFVGQVNAFLQNYLCRTSIPTDLQ